MDSNAAGLRALSCAEPRRSAAKAYRLRRTFVLTMTYFGAGRAAPLTWPEGQVSLRLSRLACAAHAAGCTLLLRVSVGHRRGTRARKKPGLFRGRAFSLHRVLTMTYFHAVYPALSSARLRFTVLFGMGRRGATALWSSGIQLVRGQVTRRSVTPDAFWKK